MTSRSKRQPSPLSIFSESLLRDAAGWRLAPARPHRQLQHYDFVLHREVCARREPPPHIGHPPRITVIYSFSGSSFSGQSGCGRDR